MKNYNEMPSDYPVCGHSECPRGKDCLHRIAYHRLVEREHFLRLLNPNECNAGTNCKHYRDSAPVMFARGFTNFQKQMYPDQYALFLKRMVSRFGKYNYFAKRRGESLITPGEQVILLNELRACGVRQAIPFDSYEELPDWYK